MAIEHEYSRVIHHGGRTFFATRTMCDIFVAHAHDTVERGDTELVPLLHHSGVDMLLVGPGVPYAVSDIEVGQAPPAPTRRPHHRAAG